MNSNPRLGVLAAAACLILLLAACGSSDLSSDGDPTDSPAVSTVEASDDGSTEVTVSDLESKYFGSYTLADDEFGTMVTVTVDGDTRQITTNALPDHETGEFPNSGNPNTISEQDLTYVYTTEPVYAGNAAEVRTSGVAVNGVKFEPGTAETVSCDSGETYRIEALQDIYNLGLDFNNAHVQPTGEYHYHGISELLVEAYESDQDLVHIGFAADGFMMYYSKSGAYESGYALSTDARTGTDCVATGPGSGVAEIDGTTPDGTYDLDWVWGETNGDLDSCNGITIDGQYAYIVTNGYPYVTRCLNGEVAGDGPPPGDAGGQEGGTPPQGGAGPDLAAAAAVLGVSEADLMAALGPPPPDFEAAAATLGVTAEDLQAALGVSGDQSSG